MSAGRIAKTRLPPLRKNSEGDFVFPKVFFRGVFRCDLSRAGRSEAVGKQGGRKASPKGEKTMEDNRLLDVAAVAGLLGISERGCWRFRDGGRMPAPVTLGRLVRWRQSDLTAWIAAGCPDVRRTGWKPDGGNTARQCKGGCHHD